LSLLAGAESLKYFHCCRLVCDVLECPCCVLDLGDGGLGPLETEAREPPQRGALKPLRFGLADRDADGEGVDELDARQLAGGIADEREIACLERPLETRVRRSLTRHERMFACELRRRRPPLSPTPTDSAAHAPLARSSAPCCCAPGCRPAMSQPPGAQTRSGNGLPRARAGTAPRPVRAPSPSQCV
jgi:hypothetical protein